MIEGIVNDLAIFVRTHSWPLCTAWAASLLVIYGSKLTRFTKNIARSWSFPFRVAFFVVVCGFGYGFLTLAIARLIHSQMLRLDNVWLTVSALGAFLLLGFLAEKHRVI